MNVMAMTLDKSNKNEIGMMAAGAGAVIAAFLPWVKVMGVFSLNGIEGDGQISAVAGVVLFLMGLLLLKDQAVKALSIVGIIAGAVIALLGLYHWDNLGDVGSVQIGVYATIVAGVVGTVMAGQSLGRRGEAESQDGEAPRPEEAPTVPAGWHPDPYGDTTIMRFWDGAIWTDQTSPAQPPTGDQ